MYGAWSLKISGWHTLVATVPVPDPDNPAVLVPSTGTVSYSPVSSFMEGMAVLFIFWNLWRGAVFYRLILLAVVFGGVFYAGEAFQVLFNSGWRFIAAFGFIEVGMGLLWAIAMLVETACSVYRLHTKGVEPMPEIIWDGVKKSRG